MTTPTSRSTRPVGGASPARRWPRCATSTLALHNRLDTLAENMKTGAAIYTTTEEDRAAALRSVAEHTAPTTPSFDPADL